MARYEMDIRWVAGVIAETHVFDVLRDGVVIDAYEDRSLAEGYVKYMNERETT